MSPATALLHNVSTNINTIAPTLLNLTIDMTWLVAVALATVAMSVALKTKID